MQIVVFSFLRVLFLLWSHSWLVCELRHTLVCINTKHLLVGKDTCERKMLLSSCIIQRCGLSRIPITNMIIWPWRRKPVWNPRWTWFCNVYNGTRVVVESFAHHEVVLSWLEFLKLHSTLSFGTNGQEGPPKKFWTNYGKHELHWGVLVAIWFSCHSSNWKMGISN